MADALFNEADINKDDRLDLNEFRSLLARSLGSESASFGASGSVGGNYAAGSFESSAAYGDVNGASSGFSGSAEFAGAAVGVAGASADQSSYSSYEQTSFAGASSSFESGGFSASGSSAVDESSAAAGFSTSSFDVNSYQQQLQMLSGNNKNIYQDPNPQVVRRPAPGGGVTYTQNIRVRYLQPPPLPPPGPLIIKEVRPPQPPLPPPLRIRQQAANLPQPPPLILRERPPVAPAPIASQTVIRKLAAIPVPPRSVIIERIPPLPAKPRDIVIERWTPYGPQAKRKTVVQRAAAAKPYPAPRNVIIQYEPVQVRVVRQFQRLGVAPENPQVYVQRYGASLLDTQTLLRQARAAGVVEDISPSQVVSAAAANSTSFNAEFASGNSGFETAVGGSFTVGGDAGASASSFESSSFSSAEQGNASFGGFGVAEASSASYEVNSSSFQGGDVQLNGASASEYENFTSSIGANQGDAADPIAAAFQAADTNKDGTLDVNEFRQFLGSQIKF